MSENEVCDLYFIRVCQVCVSIFLQVKKVILLVDAVTNGIWAFMWFVCFCYTADQLRNNVIQNLPTGAYNCAGAGIAFSFFCILIWVSGMVSV